MDQVPLYQGETPIGEVRIRPGEDTTEFEIRARLPEEGLWCGWLVGDSGELRLGLVEGEKLFCRRFSHRMTRPLGTPVRAELRPAGAVQPEQSWQAPEVCPMNFRTPALRELLQREGVLVRRKGPLRCAAVPYEPARPFPLPSMFCFASGICIREKRYLLFCFDEQEWPVFL